MKPHDLSGMPQYNGLPAGCVRNLVLFSAATSLSRETLSYIEERVSRKEEIADALGDY